MNRHLLISLSITLSMISCTAVSMQGKRSYEEAFANDPFAELYTLDELNTLTPAEKTPRTEADIFSDIQAWENLDLDLAAQSGQNTELMSSTQGDQENAPLYPSQNTYLSSREINARNETIVQNEEEPIECAGIYNMQKSQFSQTSKFTPILGTFETLPARSTFVWFSQQIEPNNNSSSSSTPCHVQKISSYSLKTQLNRNKAHCPTRSEQVEKWTATGNFKSIMINGTAEHVQTLIANKQAYPDMFVDLLTRSIAFRNRSLQKFAKQFKKVQGADSEVVSLVYAAINNFVERNQIALNKISDTTQKQFKRMQDNQDKATMLLATFAPSQAYNAPASASENQ